MSIFSRCCDNAICGINKNASIKFLKFIIISFSHNTILGYRCNRVKLSLLFSYKITFLIVYSIWIGLLKRHECVFVCRYSLYFYIFTFINVAYLRHAVCLRFVFTNIVSLTGQVSTMLCFLSCTILYFLFVLSILQFVFFNVKSFYYLNSVILQSK